MSGWVLLILALVVGMFLGKIAHEATHAVVAWLLGADEIQVKAFTLGRQHVSYRLSGGSWRHRAIGYAPLAVGALVLLPGYLALFGRFSWDVTDLGFAAAWTWYTLLGGIEDYRFDRERLTGQVTEAD